MAMGARRADCRSSRSFPPAHCEQVKAAHSSGKKLIDFADVIIDNQCPPGDCVVELEGLDWRTGPLPTVTGGNDFQYDPLRNCRALLARGIKPVCCPATNLSAIPAPRLNSMHSTKPIERVSSTCSNNRIRTCVTG